MSDLSNTEWIERFEAELKRRFHDRSTAKHYVSDLRLFVEHHPGPLAAVSSEDLAAFVDQQHEQGLKPATVKRRVAALKTFFDFLAEVLGEPRRPNPVSVRRHAGRQPQLLPRDLSDTEVERLLAVVDEVRDRAMIDLMLYAGLRVGEVTTLRPTDISEPTDPAAPIRLRVMGKGRKERVAYLCREGYEPLARYLQETAAAQVQARLDRQAPIFRNHLGKPITIAGIQERVAHYAQRSGVAVTCHRLRHTYGRWLAEREMPVLSLARLLGHVSLQTTQRYIDGADPQVRRSYESAMAQRANVPEEPTAGQEPVRLDQASTLATVVREATPSVDGANWLPEAPDWLRQGVLDWLRHQWASWKPSQRRHHAQVRLRELRQFWQWQLARRALSGWQELTSADIAAFMDVGLERGLQAKTVKTTLDRLYEVLRYLEGQGRLAAIPDRPGLRLPDPLPRDLLPQEVLALEAEVERRQNRAEASARLDLALYYLLGHGGLRISEALDLQVQDLDLAGRRVRVREGKGRRDRVVYLTAKATAVLGEYLQTVPHAPGDLVLSWQGQPLRYEQAWERIYCLGRTAGISGLSPHRLRHTYATYLLNHGVSIDALRRLMGHENLNTTLIYARLADTTLERQYRAAMAPPAPNPVYSV